MSQRPSPLAAFHLIGERPRGEPGKAARAGLRPAAFGAYRDLSKIRYDCPLVLLSSVPDGESEENNGAGDGRDFVKSLSDISDEILQEIAPRGIAGEQIRRQVLGLEQEIRSLVAAGRKGSLSRLWDVARRNMMSGADKDTRKALGANLEKARGALRYDGETLECDQHLPLRLVRRAWAVSQHLKERRLGARIEQLAQKLSDILQVDFLHSDKARGARHLERSVGSADQKVFDFKAMSDILSSAPIGGPLPENRQRRIRAAISALESQRFASTTNGIGRKRRDKAAFAFAFDSCGEALNAFRDRLGDMTGLIKAIAIAELEIANRYDEPRHDAFFRRFDETSLGPEDLAMFPSYLVCLAGGVGSAAEQAALFEVLCAGLPIKIVAQSDDILEDLPIGSGQLSFGTRGQQIANMALGLGNVFVLQSAASSLYRLRTRILNGLAGDRPALFSIFSGCNKASSATVPYLTAAAASEARAFPCFVYDPGAGEDDACRFQLDGNPQADADWPLQVLQYEDSEHNRLADESAFTFVDFVACDARYAAHFACITQSDWHDGMVPVSAFLEDDAACGDNGTAAKVPYIWMIDDSNGLHRAVVDNRLIDAARRCRDLWRGLQKRGGVHDADARALLAEAKEAWEEERERLLAAQLGQTGQGTEGSASAALEEAAITAQVTAPPATTGAATPEAAELPPDEPYIETARCTTCNECTEINNKMFVYDENMQAYIADPDAGSYRQLVEAAEACQVCIIHPGPPQNRSEPDLDELAERAAAFSGP